MISFKLVMAKAYDHVNWGFLHSLLMKHGFEERSISWIMHGVSTAHFSVLVNDTPTCFFNTSHGLRQGDPLSPQLFVIDTEAFSRRLTVMVQVAL